MKVAFFGTSDKSVSILNTLKVNFDLVLCVTKVDTKVGRKQEVRETAVKKWAKENKVDYIEIDGLKGEKSAPIISGLLSKGVELGVVADFDFIIPESILSTPKYGMINIHFSLLPKYRGASPVQHTILNGDTKTGVTYQLMDKGMDTGDVIYQFEHDLKGNETTKDLYEELFDKAAHKLPEVINKYINGDLKSLKQDESEATYCYSKTKPKSTYIYKEDAKIDWGNNLENIYRMSRAFYPWPITWTTLEDLKTPTLALTKQGIMSNINTLKSTISPNNYTLKDLNKDIRIKIIETEYGNNTLIIKKIQPEGKNVITWSEFLNGYAKLG